MCRFLDIRYEPEESARTKAYVRWKRRNKAAMDAEDRKPVGWSGMAERRQLLRRHLGASSAFR